MIRFKVSPRRIGMTVSREPISIKAERVSVVDGKEAYDRGYKEGYDANQANFDNVLSGEAVTLRTTAQSIRAYGLSYCNRLEYIDAPYLRSLGTRAISECNNLVRVDFPSLASIGANALRYNEKLAVIILRADKVCSLNSAASIGGSAIVYVPDALIDDYRTAAKWESIADRIKPLSELES